MFPILTDKQVADLGCGEGSLLQVLLNDSCFCKISGIDIEETALSRAVSECQPTTYDFQFPREQKLDFNIYNGYINLGSILIPDARFLNHDAITLIEVIEHLDLSDLALLPQVVFGCYQPRIVIITTPNAEFNVHFPNLEYGSPNAKFRHWDHRCEGVSERYGYTPTFRAIGRGQKTEVGGCTQVCVFERNVDRSEVELPTPHKLVACIEFPVFVQELDLVGQCEEMLKITYEIVWNEWCYDHGVSVIPIDEIDDYPEPNLVKRSWPLEAGEVVFEFSQLWSNWRIRNVWGGDLVFLIEQICNGQLKGLFQLKKDNEIGEETDLEFKKIAEKADLFVSPSEIGKGFQVVVLFPIPALKPTQGENIEESEKDWELEHTEEF
ncbi:Small RNA 2'-O-methyltransferase [Nowakowskiella sp. JEL0078]|nr:Small RNA 2'-O-methyltransferase [Nowakowskiella sp. JEL0078]